jgi:mannose-6-phosphate isomerase-like protein (cupin superfamily)
MKALWVALFAATCATPAFGQGRATQPPPTTQPPATQPPSPTQPARPRPAARPVAPHVTVRDQSGTAVAGAKLTISGAVSGAVTTDESGSAILSSLKDGTYRLRCEHDGFVTLEREFVVRASQPASIDVTLNRAPAPPPQPLSAPAPPPAPKPAAPSPVPPSGPPVRLNIVDFLERNEIGRGDPLKESVIACNGLETVRLLQLKDPVAEHTHSNMDEVLYVVAGEGTIFLGTQEAQVSGRTASLVVVPHGTPHKIQRRGARPLILLSTLSGAPCPNAR